MPNPNIIILSLFTVGGLAAAVWGWVIIARGRQSLGWPTVEGIVVTSEAEDLLPHIVYRYGVEGEAFETTLKFPGDLTPTREFTQSYLQRFPTGKKVTVYYDPRDPATATLEPGPGRGDWLVFAFGLGALVVGALSLLFSG